MSQASGMLKCVLNINLTFAFHDVFFLVINLIDSETHEQVPFPEGDRAPPFDVIVIQCRSQIYYKLIIFWKCTFKLYMKFERIQFFYEKFWVPVFGYILSKFVFLIESKKQDSKNKKK